MDALKVYERELDQNPEWALLEGSMHFEEKSAVQKSLQRMVGRLKDLNVSYALVGGMAMYYHGYRRFTEDVDFLVTADVLKTIHSQLEGRGYLPPFAGSKQLRDTESGVKIEFLVTGGFPGDGKPKPVSFPDPATCAVEILGMKVIQLPTLVDLKLASGMTNVSRAKDIADVVEMIKHLKLEEKFSEKLNPYVREKYGELWRAIRDNPYDPQA